MTAYETTMIFQATISVPELNKISDMCYAPHICAKDALEVKIDTVLEKIPGEDALAEIAEKLREAYNSTGKVFCEDMKFARYDKLLPVEA